MPYDAKLDEKLFSKFYEGENDRVVVSVYSYNKGQKKLQLSREGLSAEGETRFAKLGRMTKAEVQGVLPIINEALAFLD